MYLASLYSSGNNIAIKSATHVLNKYGHLLKFKKNESILEIGTGDGRTTIETLLPRIPQDIKEFIASDKSWSMINHARNMEAFDKIPVVELDIESKVIPENFENRFDHIFAIFVFHFVKNTRQGLQNIHSMLRPGGKVFGVFLSETIADEAWYSLSKNPRWSKYDPNAWVSPYFGNPKVSEIFLQHLSDCGYKNCVLQSDDYQYDFNSAKEFQDLMTAINLSVDKIPKKYLDEYLDEYFNLAKNGKLWSMKKSENGEELLCTIMKMVTFYGQK